MPPFPLPTVAPDRPSPPPSVTSTANSHSSSGAAGFASSLLKTFGRVTSARAPPTVSETLTSTSAHSSRDHVGGPGGGRRPGITGSSSRAAGVRPAKGTATSGLSVSAHVPRREDSTSQDFDSRMGSGKVRADAAGHSVAGPSRGGFIVNHAEPAVVVKNLAHPTSPVLDQPVASTSGLASPVLATVPLPVPAIAKPKSAEPVDLPLPPPSTIILRIGQVNAKSDSETLISLIHVLAKSVSLYLYPPPAIIAGKLSSALTPENTAPNLGSPLEIYLSQQSLLSQSSNKGLRAAVLELLGACVEASIKATGGIKERDKGVYWDEARRWAEEGKKESANERGERRWTLPNADREALVTILSSLTKGGRDLSDVPGLVALLCTFVTDSLPLSLPPSPLYDPKLLTPFIRTTPIVAAPHASSLALLTALHKFSAPHIYTASTLMALRAALEIAKLPEERNIAGSSDSDVLSFIGAVVRFGEVTGGKAAKARRDLVEAARTRGDSLGGVNEGDEILREVVSVVARMIGCDGHIGVKEVYAGQSLAKVDPKRLLPSIIPPLALQLMRDLLRSPANQALKSLRNMLVAPPTTTPLPPTPVLLLVGILRALRKSLMEHANEAEASLNRGESASLSTGESRWPTMLSLGLPFLWNGLNRVMLWKSGRVDAEVLRMVEERLVLSEAAALGAEQRGKEAALLAAASTDLDVNGRTRVKEAEEKESGAAGITFEEWDMAIEVLAKTAWHIGAWEDLKKKAWVMNDDIEEDESSEEEEETARFTQKAGVLSAFSSLLRKVVLAWRDPAFTGPSERLFTLLISISPHLADSQSLIILEQCDRNELCLPTHPEWLDRIQEVVRAFYVPSTARNPNLRTIRRGASSGTRRRALQLLASVHSHLRPLEDASRDTLVVEVVLPLLESNFETETDSEVGKVLVGLLVDIAGDAVLEGSVDSTEVSTQIFERLRSLLVRIARGSAKSTDRFASPGTPRQTQKRGVGLSSLSRHPSVSAPMSASTTLTSPPPDVNDVPILTISALTSIFHTCLARSSKSSSEKAILIFRDLLALLVPTMTSSPESTEITPSIITRFAILQWLVRLRADAAHRIHWVKEVEISGPARLIGRCEVSPPVTNDALSDGTRGVEEGAREERGRTARGEPANRSGREASGSRVRMQSEERSPSRGSGSRMKAATLTPTLWTVPELLTFEFGTSLSAMGATGLVSFDHNRMREWTEEEDPGTGLMKVEVKEIEDETSVADIMIILPVSEYLRAINYLLQHELDWEIISYILCHLPEQLSNKHFAAGPRASQQIHRLRTQLCDGLRGGDRPLLGEVALPTGIKRAEVHAVAYSCLTTLIAYRSLFSKSQQDDMVITFMFGLGNPRDTAKVCIHALAMATFELRPSVTKHLAEIVRHLQKIISSATLGVHILELIAGVGQEPSLFANFTELDYQTVFGIALKYIQAHNERIGDDPKAYEVEAGLEYAFSQYVFLLAYYSIAQWFLALRLSERPKYVAFLTRRLVQANEGKAEIDEPTEVCFDMIARYAYTNADPRPRYSAFDEIITAGVTTRPSKTWIIGNAAMTVKSTPAPAWVEVTIRRASGVVRMLWELQNISGVGSNSDGDLIAMHLRHREASLLTTTLPSVVSEALSTLPGHHQQPHLGFRARAHTIGGAPAAVYPTITENTVSNAINAAATVAAATSLESGLLSVDPGFFALQLSSFPDFGATGPPLLLPNDPATLRGISTLDRLPIVDFHKIGVLYAGPGQRNEFEILGNTHGSKAYVELISSLGKLVRLKGSRELDIYAGGLDQETDIDGKWTYLWDDDISQIVFHVATLMPTSVTTDPQCTLKKRHIGNDFVKIVFNDSGEDFAFDTLPGDFNFVNIIIQPHTPAGNPWIGPGMTSNAEFFKVSMQCRPGMPEVGPLGTFKMVTGSSLPNFVRQLSLHSNIFAQIYLASVGFEARAGTTQKVEYSSNWRRRLQQIKMMKSRILEAQGKKPEVPTGTFDFDAAESKRSFTQWS